MLCRIRSRPDSTPFLSEFILSFHKYRLESRIIKIVKQVSEDAFDEARSFDYNKEYLPDKYENKKGF